MGSDWHPIFLTDEPQPGVWVMKYAHEIEAFGRIEIRRVSGVIRYKVILHGEVVGWSNTLQHACERLYVLEGERREKVYKGPSNGRP